MRVLLNHIILAAIGQPPHVCDQKRAVDGGFGPDWTARVISPETQFFNDINGGHLAPVTWIVPDEKNSDHDGSASTSGPDWVASIVNVIGQSSFWQSTAIFVTWDDWGGWYDHTVPTARDVMGPGFRVPLIVVSPYARHGSFRT